MIQTFIYRLETNEGERAILKNQQMDYAHLCNQIAAQLAHFEGRDVDAADKYLMKTMGVELKRILVGTGTNKKNPAVSIYPSEYRKLACRRVLADFAEFGTDYRYSVDTVVDMSTSVATVKVNKLNEAPSAAITIKLFASPRGDKYRLRVPYVSGEPSVQITLPRGAVQLLCEGDEFFIAAGVEVTE